MMMDEMEDFFYQTLMTMADTYQRATRHDDLAARNEEFRQRPSIRNQEPNS